MKKSINLIILLVSTLFILNLFFSYATAQPINLPYYPYLKGCSVGIAPGCPQIPCPESYTSNYPAKEVLPGDWCYYGYSCCAVTTFPCVIPSTCTLPDARCYYQYKSTCDAPTCSDPDSGAGKNDIFISGSATYTYYTCEYTGCSKQTYTVSDICGIDTSTIYEAVCDIVLKYPTGVEQPCPPGTTCIGFPAKCYPPPLPPPCKESDSGRVYGTAGDCSDADGKAGDDVCVLSPTDATPIGVSEYLKEFYCEDIGYGVYRCKSEIIQCQSKIAGTR